MRRTPRAPVRPLSHVAAWRLAATGLIAALLTSGLFVLIQPASAARATTYSATASTIAPVASVDPLHPSASLTASTASASHSRAARSTRPLHAKAAKQVSAPNAASALDDPQPGTLLNGFNGVSSLDSAVTNFGAEFEPPDQGLCAGNGFVLEPVNSAYTIYRANGTVVAGPINVNAIFDEGFAEFTSDPRCQYDRATNTWYAVILFINAKGTIGRTDLAVNTSGDPTTPWTVYHIDGTDKGGPGCPCFGDQPLLGIDSQNIYISTNEFSILGPQFNGAQIYAVAKSDLIGHGHSIHVVHFSNLNIGGAQAASVQPAITNGASNAEYFFNSLDPNGTGDTRLGVWALTNRDAVAKGKLPTLSSVVITSEAYSIPPDAIQQGGQGSVLASDDDRMQQAQFINGTLYGALDTAFVPTGEFFPLAAAAWFEVHPTLSGQTIAGATVGAQGYLVSDTNYLLYPAIQADANGDAAMVFTISGPTIFPSAAYAMLKPGHANFGTIHIAGAGTGPYAPSSTRWGDYSWAVLAPDGNSFWLATEYIPPLASQTTDGLQNWGTYVMQVAASGD